MTPSADNRRPENLALIFQEAFTAIERLRANRQGVTDANAFRHHMREAFKSATNTALAAGYNADDTRYATYAVVAFLDESVLISHNPVFADWLRKPLQEEMFSVQIAGEVFFQNLQQLLGRSDSSDLADLLEVYYLCMLLGFSGRYSAGNRGELSQAMTMTKEKIQRIRGRFAGLSPSWMVPREGVAGRADPWVRKLGWIAGITAGVMLLLFILYKVVLNNGVQV
jgi:type VI secretion system protein ImpK